jgi:hypothetical protein
MTPARHFSAFNFSAYLPSIGPRRTMSPAIEGFETIGCSVPIRNTNDQNLRAVRKFPQ